MNSQSLINHRVQMVTGPVLRFRCVGCQAELTNDPNDRTKAVQAYADLDGKPFVDYYCYRCATAAGADLDVIRYVVTHVNKDGDRVLSHAAQGRNTYATAEEAQRWIEAARKNNSADTMKSVYGEKDTLEVRPCKCYPVHFDPKSRYFDLDETAGYTCQACGREEGVCSANPCEAVIRDREAAL